jgi:hypothetical protein
MAEKAEFGSLNLEEMAGEDTRLHTSAGGNNFLDQFVPMPDVKPGQTGSVTLRVLPPVKGGRLFQYNRVHTMNGRKVHCPRPLANGKWDRNVACPICDYYSGLWRQADKLDKAGHGAEADKLKDEARDIKPVERYYYNAIVRSLTIDGETKTNVGPRILSVGKILHKAIIRAIVGDDNDPESKLGNITDLKNGFDFVIRKEVTPGEGFPKYDRSAFARTTSPTGDPAEIKRWVDALHDLTKLRNPKDLEVLEKELAIHRGLIADDTEAFNTEEFDAKWKAKANEDVQELMEHTPGGVAVPADVPAATATETTEAPAETAAAPAEDLNIEDDDFLSQLDEFEDKK